MTKINTVSIKRTQITDDALDLIDNADTSEENKKHFVSIPLTQTIYKHTILSKWPKLASNNSITLHYLNIFKLIRETGLPNYMEAKIPLPSGLNISRWRDRLKDTTFYYIVDFLE